MTDKSMANTELLSALVDGQLSGDEFVRAMALLERSSEARQSWYAYHVVGDALRTGQADVSAHEADFVLGLRARLQQETLPSRLQAAPDSMIPDAALPGARDRQGEQRPSANDRYWRLVVGLASVAMVGVIAWQGFQGSGSTRAQLASAPVATPASTPQLAVSPAPVMLRDPQLDALLAAHRQFGGTSALQMPTGFLRNATFEEGAR
ncbi:sigma-E factor negative regulatory protein [Rhodoferax sp.]|uniref:sigma-E factor negative regulatory protein n=1 Tax=Rhodoferax sp. TaxID=50421 RepID=UPI00262A6C49|nr:sigma-E factor negative regulatory protein [Rhodoferax sp.]MDD2917470.1 sigma-E factor negative regulatory protein [Rhodoferax sp.]